MLKRISLLCTLALALLFALPSMAQAITCAQGTVGLAPTATLTWTAPTKNQDGTTIAKLPLTFNVYMGTVQGTYPTKIVSGVSTLTSTVTANLASGTTYYFVGTAVDSSGGEGAQTNPVCKAFPATTPGTYTLTVSHNLSDHLPLERNLAW